MDGTHQLAEVSRSRTRAWRPMHVAIALLMTNSEAFADEVEQDPGAAKCIALDFAIRFASKKHKQQSPISIVRSCDEAWLHLRALIEDGKVEARGTAVDRYRRGTESSQDSTHPPSILAPDQVSGLVLWDKPNDETWLRPNDKTIFGQGRHWKRIAIHWPSLLKAIKGELKLAAAGKYREATPRARSGRPRDFLPDHLRALKGELLRLLEEYGDPQQYDAHREFRSLEQIYRRLQDFANGKPRMFHKEPSRQTLQPLVKEWLEEWRSISPAKIK